MLAWTSLVVLVISKRLLYSLVPKGRWRQAGKWVATGLVALLAFTIDLVEHRWLAITATSLVRALTWLLPIPVGIGCYLWWRRRSWVAPATTVPSAVGAGRP